MKRDRIELVRAAGQSTGPGRPSGVGAHGDEAATPACAIGAARPEVACPAVASPAVASMVVASSAVGVCNDRCDAGEGDPVPMCRSRQASAGVPAKSVGLHPSGMRGFVYQGQGMNVTSTILAFTTV